MDITLNILLLILGFTILVFGGDFLVKGAVGVAKKFNISPLIIGLTIIAAGTSAPEIITSCIASLKGNTDIAIGNIVGSNLFNILGVLGISAFLATSRTSKSIIKSEYILLLIFTLTFIGLTRDLEIGIVDASICLGLLVCFILFTIYKAKKSNLDPDEEELETYDNFLYTVLALIGGFVFLIIGSEFALKAGINLGKIAGLSDRIIGLTIISVGTGLPELAASAMAAIRKQGDLAFSNIIGSNIINTLGIPAAVGLFNTAQINSSIISFDSPFLLIATFIILPLAYVSKFSFSKPQGSLLIAMYIGYITYLSLNI